MLSATIGMTPMTRLYARDTMHPTRLISRRRVIRCCSIETTMMAVPSHPIASHNTSPIATSCTCDPDHKCVHRSFQPTTSHRGPVAAQARRRPDLWKALKHAELAWTPLPPRRDLRRDRYELRDLLGHLGEYREVRTGPVEGRAE